MASQCLQTQCGMLINTLQSWASILCFALKMMGMGGIEAELGVQDGGLGISLEA